MRKRAFQIFASNAMPHSPSVAGGRKSELHPAWDSKFWELIYQDEAVV